jgi:hypothetical protein
MTISEETENIPLVIQLHRTLLSLARREADAAADEAATVPYWAPVPASVSAHRSAAAALRSEAERVLRAAS